MCVHVSNQDVECVSDLVVPCTFLPVLTERGQWFDKLVGKANVRTRCNSAFSACETSLKVELAFSNDWKKTNKKLASLGTKIRPQLSLTLKFFILSSCSSCKYICPIHTWTSCFPGMEIFYFCSDHAADDESTKKIVFFLIFFSIFLSFYKSSRFRKDFLIFQ